MTPPLMSEDEFLTTPIELVRSLVPATVVIAIGGTRRAASLAGLDHTSDAYLAWARRQQIQLLAHVSVVHRTLELGICPTARNLAAAPLLPPTTCPPRATHLLLKFLSCNDIILQHKVTELNSGDPQRSK